MNKVKIYKFIQLILFLILTAVSAYILLTNSELSDSAKAGARILTLSLLLWAALGLSLVFLILDFCFFVSPKKLRHESASATVPAPVHIGGRSDCDAFIEKYLDMPLPENIGCIMFELVNLKEINQTHGHRQGNVLIQQFSVFLQAASLDLCFVGRNGGNKFLAIFEDCDYEKIKTFLALLDKKIDKHNKLSDVHPIRFRFGIAFDEGAKVHSITDLIALSDKRIGNT